MMKAENGLHIPEFQIDAIDLKSDIVVKIHVEMKRDLHYVSQTSRKSW